MSRAFARVTLGLLLVGCERNAHDESATAADDGRVPAVSDTVRYSLADFQALRYVEGDWRGSGYDGGPFFETYRFVNDSTIEMTAWADSSMTAAREQSQYILRGGVIQTSKGARLVRVDQDGHRFEAASHGWTFRQESADRWTARVGPSTTYTMDRIARP